VWDGAQMAIFCVTYASCIFNEPRAAHFTQIRTKATPCVEVWQTSNLQPLRLGEEIKNKEERNRMKLECGPMPNVMAALPNIGGALCSTLQSLADAHY